jgi:predicted transglutaminase-like cysteine proteinase
VVGTARGRRAFLGDALTATLVVLNSPRDVLPKPAGDADHPAARRVRAVLWRHRRQRRAGPTALARARITPDALQAWRDAVATVGLLHGRRAVAAAHEFMNRVPYRSDLATYNVEDRWSTPLEFLAHGGDCEGYALAKYALLREAAGIAADDLRLLVLRATSERPAHAVLEVNLAGRRLLLDNREPAPVPAAGGLGLAYAANEAAGWSYPLQEL